MSTHSNKHTQPSVSSLLLALSVASSGCAGGSTVGSAGSIEGLRGDHDAGVAQDAAAGGAGGASSAPPVLIANTGGTDGEGIFGGEFGEIPERSPDAGVARCGTKLTGVVRDFRQAHADFEEVPCVCDDRGIVTDTLGPDGKPVYAGNPTTPSTSGAENFDQWYRDVDGVNQAVPFTFSLAQGANNVWTYEDPEFFPIDNQLFGNEGNPHNFHFTFELHTEFIYRGGEVFTFSGDDDVFTYINGKRVVDLGGIHAAETATVRLDDEAARLDLEIGKTYPLAFFFAERHMIQSEFRIDTTLEFTKCGEIR